MQGYWVNEEDLSERVAYRIIRYRVSIPTWITLYLNLLMSAIVANTVYLEDSPMFDELTPFGGHLWSALLMLASLVTVHGLASNYNKTVAWGAALGYIAWSMILVSWMVMSSGDYYYVPMVAIPMIGFFMFVHLKHSIIQRWEDSVEEEEA